MRILLFIALVLILSFPADGRAFEQPPSQPFEIEPQLTEEEAGDAPQSAEDEYLEEEQPGIADPLYPFNKAMYHFNDKLYFWLLQPAGRGYAKVLPEDIRISVSHFFSNITSPVRVASCLLQGRLKDAGNETVRFVYNSTAGILGLTDAAKEDLEIGRKDEDIGQALGKYGIGHGFYIVWPFLGPSSLRDTAGRVGDSFLNPVSYINPWDSRVGLAVYERVNFISLRLGEYEELKEAAVDPYVSIRNGYLQRRKAQVER
jgi:phospholipid-binding lipoprotein MlaA